MCRMHFFQNGLFRRPSSIKALIICKDDMNQFFFSGYEENFLDLFSGKWLLLKNLELDITTSLSYKLMEYYVRYQSRKDEKLIPKNR